MIHTLRLLHILSGAFWYGSVVFIAWFLLPSLRAAGPAAGQVMAQINQRRMPLFMMGAAFVNLVSGIWLVFVVSGGAPAAWMQSAMGRMIGIGAGLAILTLIIGMVVNGPVARRMGQIAAAAAKRGGPPSPEETAEVARLQKRLGVAGVSVMLLLTLAVAAMAVARYM